jgi:hypothetical protein
MATPTANICTVVIATTVHPKRELVSGETNQGQLFDDFEGLDYSRTRLHV